MYTVHKYSSTHVIWDVMIKNLAEQMMWRNILLPFAGNTFLHQNVVNFLHGVTTQRTEPAEVSKV